MNWGGESPTEVNAISLTQQSKSLATEIIADILEPPDTLNSWHGEQWADSTERR